MLWQICWNELPMRRADFRNGKCNRITERITEATERTGEYLGNDEHNRGTIIGQISGLRHDLRLVN